MSNIPSTLYKYINWDNKYHKKIITHGEIFFADFSKLNDPNEGNILLSFGNYSDEEIIMLYEKHLKSQHPHLKKERKRLKKLARSEFYKHRKVRENKQLQMDITYDHLIEHFGIFSLSSLSTSNPMWAHYSNNHQGLCIGLNTAKLMEFRQDVFDDNGIIIVLEKVIYTDEFSIDFKELKQNEEQAFKEILCRKTKDWSYEKEYRFVSITGKPNFSLNLNPDVIEEIIFGRQMDQRTTQEITEIVKEKYPHVKLLKAEHVKGQTELHLSELNI